MWLPSTDLWVLFATLQYPRSWLDLDRCDLKSESRVHCQARFLRDSYHV